MDISKEYIKMCKEAKEIQSLRKRKPKYIRPEWEGSIGLTKDGHNFIDEDDTPDWEGLTYFNTVDNEGSVGIWDERIADEFGVTIKCNAIWLPRQDQLQEMLLDFDDPLNRFMTSVCYSTLVCNFAQFCGVLDEDAEGRSNCDIRKESLEVLWLAFVMAEKYRKVWNGDKWIKDDDIDFGKPKRLLPWEVE